MSERAARHPRKRVPLIAGILAAAAAAVFAVASIAAPPPIEGTNGISAWNNNSPTITTAESVTFKNSSATTSHGVAFTAPPAAPNCTGVPNVGQTSWEGSCTFSQAGSYAFHCVVHAGMTGTITVNDSGPPPPTATTGTGTPTSTTEATLQGSVNPNGQATEYFFKYGTSESYGQVTSKEDAGSGTSPVAASRRARPTISSCSPNTALAAPSTASTTPSRPRARPRR